MQFTWILFSFSLTGTGFRLMNSSNQTCLRDGSSLDEKLSASPSSVAISYKSTEKSTCTWYSQFLHVRGIQSFYMYVVFSFYMYLVFTVSTCTWYSVSTCTWYSQFLHVRGIQFLHVRGIHSFYMYVVFSFYMYVVFKVSTCTWYRIETIESGF